MLKLIATSLLLCTFLYAINAEENPTISKEIKLYKSDSTSVVDGSHLLILASNRTHILLNSTDENAKVCEIAIDHTEHPIQKKFKATMLGDKIIVWGVRAKYSVNQKTKMDYTILIVDPKKCTYEPMKTYEEELEPTYWFDINKNLPEVVTHDDSFDVFYSTMRACTPCRYSIDGKTVALKQVIGDERLERSSLSYVKPFHSPNIKNGFVYTHNYNNGTSFIKLYDQNFNLMNQKDFDHCRIEGVAVTSGDHPSTIFCYVPANEKPPYGDKLFCIRFGAKLEVVFSINLPLLENYKPADVSVDIDDISGDIFVTVKEINESEKKQAFKLYRLSSTGQVIKIFKLHEGEIVKLWHRPKMVLRGFIFNKQYCFETTNMWSMFTPYDADENESVKCFAI